MLESIEPNKQNIEAKSADDLEFLSRFPDPLYSLVITDQAVFNLPLVIQVIANNRKTLLTLVLDGRKREQPIDEKTSSALAVTINSCVNLKLLAIENFQATFGENIAHFYHSLKSLRTIESLSFNGTYLRHIVPLMEDLEQSKTLLKIDLSDTALVDQEDWVSVENALRVNSSLHELSLGKSPVDACNIRCIVDGVYSLANQIRVLDWTPLPFEQNEELRIKLFEAKDSKAELGALETYRRTGKHVYFDGYAIHCARLAELQEHIRERNKCIPQKNLVFHVTNERQFKLNAIAARMYLQRAHLEELTIQCDSIERHNPGLFPFEFDCFIKALSACGQLRQIKIEHLQGTFTQTQIKRIITAIATLNVQSLSFKKTYLADAGTEALVELLQNSLLVELDLTLSALISDRCFDNLAKGIKLNTSLERLVLGRSPMNASWLRTLTKVLSDRPLSRPIRIEWESSEKPEMNGRMQAMCADFYSRERELKKKIEGYCVTFCEQKSGNLEKEWSELQKHTPISTYSQLSRPLSAQSAKPSEQVMEMKELPSYKSPLNNTNQRLPYYGSTEHTQALKRI